MTPNIPDFYFLSKRSTILPAKEMGYAITFDGLDAKPPVFSLSLPNNIYGSFKREEF